MLLKVAHQIGQAYIRRICKSEYEAQTFRRINERPVEFAFVFRKLAEISPRTVLDVGTGKTSLPHLIRTCGFLVTAIDNVTDYWPKGMVNRHFHVLDDDIVKTRLQKQYDVITCVSVLEHIENCDQAIKSMANLLNDGGHLLLTFPFHETEPVDNVYELPGSSYGENTVYKTRAYCRADIDRWISDNHLELIDQQYWQYWEGKHWTVGPQVLPPRLSSASEKHQHCCLHLAKAS